MIHAGRTPEELSCEFEPSAQAIQNWAAQADWDQGRTDRSAREERTHRRNRPKASGWHPM